MRLAIRYDGGAQQLNSLTDNGKPGESRGRKANGSKVTQVTMIARPPKQNSATALRAASLGKSRALLFGQAHIRLHLIVR